MIQLKTRTTAMWVMALLFSLGAMSITCAQTPTQPGSEQRPYSGQSTVDELVGIHNWAELSGMEPAGVWRNFAKLCSIPRCSGDEHAVADSIVYWAHKRNLYAVRDAYNNVLVRIPATARRYKKRPSVCIQGHLDMVCKSLDGKPVASPLRLHHNNGDTLRTANGTTLGADDGVGVSMMLEFIRTASCHRGPQHGPIELLFTSREESGLTGAKEFYYRQLQSRRFVNVDSEVWKFATVGCAGGSRMTVNLPVTTEPVPAGYQYLQIVFRGFSGGHSGLEIGKGHPNAIILAAQVLQKVPGYRLISMFGGDKLNTIPTADTVIVAIPDGVGLDRQLGQKLRDSCISLCDRYFPNEHPVVAVTTFKPTTFYRMFDSSSTVRLLQALSSFPNGVMEHESADPTLVRTSSNLGLLSMHGDTLSLGVLARSSSVVQLDSVENVMRKLFGSSAVKIGARYPPWEPSLKSSLLAQLRTTYAGLFHQPMGINVTHGGLECAVFADKLAGLGGEPVQIVSFGPTIIGAHSPHESVLIPTVNDMWSLLQAYLLNIN